MKSLFMLLMLAIVPCSAASANCLWQNRWYAVGYVLQQPNGNRIQCQANGTWIAVRPSTARIV
jgi:hypothetical protein